VKSIHLRGLSVDLQSKKSRPVRRNSRRVTGLFPGTDPADLMNLYGDKFYNVFCSLHFDNGECFYVSEVVQRTINADFQEFKLESNESSRSRSFVLKVWLSTFKNPEDWKLLVSLPIKLSHLLYMNKELDNVQSLDMNNTILISLFDGIYLLSTKDFNLDEYQAVIYDDHHLRDINKTVPSLTYDLIMKLNNLNRNIEDVTNSKLKTSKLIDYVFEDEYYDDSVLNHHFRLNRINNMVQQSIAYSQLQKTRLQELKSLKQQKANSISKFKQQQSLKQDKLAELKQEFSDLLTLNENAKNDLIILKNEKVRELLGIFPKDEILQWLKISKTTIATNNYHFLEVFPLELDLNTLTNLISISDQHLTDQINAGFGYLAEIVFLLSRYLGIPLRYQVKPFGSTSYIVDKISQINQRNIFPLFYTNHFYRFQYAVMLLNRNIQDILKAEDPLIHY
jgi:hypothetical protein